MSKSRLSVSQVIGELLLTFGVLLLLFAFYESYWTNIASGKLQAEANERLDDEWDSSYVNPRGQVRPELGDAFARMYIPTFGSDFHFAILEGTNDDDLLRGPGRYTDSQMPGETGNFAVAGHRVGKGAPFNDLGSLESCDAIVVETQTEWITYRLLPIEGEAVDCFSPEQQDKIHNEYAGVSGRHITLPSDVSVIDPVPGTNIAVEDASEGLITLTTCHPQFSNAERMIVHAMEVDSQEKIPGEYPDILQEGN